MSKIKKDQYIENVLSKMNNSLEDVENLLISDFEVPTLPILFIIGAQRSGTTVLTQYLANIFSFSFPSNLIARFWKAPYIGSLLSYNLKINDETTSFNSKFGATSGINEPHEFSYFWKYWFPESAKNGKSFKITEKNKISLRKHLDAWQSISNEPLLFKNLLEIIPNIENLSEIFPSAVFVNIERNDFYVIQSTLESRLNYGGNYNNWFGVKPKNYLEIITNEDNLIQVIDQVFYVKQDIINSLSKIDKSRYININYEDFITNPESIIKNIENKFNIGKWRINNKIVNKSALISGNIIRLKADQIKSIKDRIQYLKKGV